LSDDDSHGDEDVEEENDSTTASEAGDMLLTTPPRSPKKLRKTRASRSMDGKVEMLPKIYYLGDDWDELFSAWAPTLGEARSHFDMDAADLDFFRSPSLGSAVGGESRRRHSTHGRFSTVLVGSDQRSVETGADKASCVKTTKASASADARCCIHPVIAELPWCIADGMDSCPTFESGWKGALKEMMAPDGSKELSVLVIASKGKRFVAPIPEEFSQKVSALLTKTSGREGDDKQSIIAATRIYAKIFCKVQGLSKDHFAPSFDGGVDAAMELLTDVRQGVLSFGRYAAFIFNRN
jgi:hypothetical protein